MDKITKVLGKLSKKEQDQIQKIISNILLGKLTTLDLKKLKGVEDTYRIRVGSIRIIFRKRYGANDIQVLDVCRRGEDTYKNL